MTSSSFEAILNKKYFIYFPQATSQQIESASKQLEELNIPKIPEDYENFLKNSNGLSYNGLELFGTEDYPREEKKYIFPSLLSSNRDFINYEFFIQKLIIGITSENFIIYDNITKNYALTDAISLHIIEEYHSFNELIKFLLKQYYED